MTPLEINKKIAQLKGLNMEEAPNLSQSALIFVGSDNHESDMYKDWAKDIKDALELFEEMPYTTNITKIASKENYDYLFYQCSIDLLNLKDIAGSAPLAICLAWIKWKEVLTYEQRYNTYEA